MEESTSSGYHRPRRPASDTITYLRGLPLDIDAAHQEVSRFLSKSANGNEDNKNQNNNGNENNNENNDDDDDDDDDDDLFFPMSLAAAFSALEEVKSEIASLAGDEYGSQSIEILARIAAPHSELASRILLNACKGYYLHLATHRYGSHVLQTILQLSSSNSSNLSSNSTSSVDVDDLALHEEAPPSLREETDDTSLPSLYDCIQGVVDELSPHATDLSVHLCGSHVLRTLLCVLGGVSLVSGHQGGGNTNNNNNNKRFEQTGGAIRGRLKSKKKKKKKPHTSDDSSSGLAPHAGTMSIVYHNQTNQNSSRIEPKRFASTLESLSRAILGERSEDPGELQQHACHTSAGPLLIVLIRVLTYTTDEARNEFSGVTGGSSSKSSSSTTTIKDDDAVALAAKNTANSSIADFRLGIGKSEPRYIEGSLADKAVKQILCWQDKQEDGEEQQDQQQEQEHASDVIYGLSGEPRGSHVLETILRLCPDDFYESLLKHGDFLSAKAMQDYAAHPVSNFVVQTMLSTVRTKEQAETVLKTAEKVIASGLPIDPTKKRRGILWRATELASKYRIEQDGMLKAIRLGFLAVKGDENGNNGDENNNPAAETTTTDNSEGDKKKKRRKKASSVELKDCIPLLIGLKRNPVDDQRITLDAAGCRAVHHMLRFSPRLCQDVLDGIIKEMSAEDLISITKDGLGSRCIMDGILDGPVKTPIYSTATKDLREKLEGSFASLATDRVGHHTVKKIFRSLPRIDDKAKLVEELVDGGNRLRGNTMGRSVIESCLVDAYEENRKEWRHRVGKMLSATTEEKFLAEVTHSIKKNNKDTITTSSSSSTDVADVVVVEGEGEEEPTKAKRKRRRKRKTNDGADNEDDNDDESRKKSQKTSSSATISTESIMDIMNVNK